jgi:SNF2 family DNA or RNA helicase
MSKVSDALKIMSKSTVLVLDESIFMRHNISRKASLKLQFADTIEPPAKTMRTVQYDDLYKVLLVLRDVRTPVVIAHYRQALDRAAEIAWIRPILVVLEWDGRPQANDPKIKLLFGDAIAVFTNLSIHSSLSSTALQQLASSNEVINFDYALSVAFARKTSPDVRIENGKISFAQDPARRWFFSQLGLGDFVYRYNKQDYRIFINNPTDAEKLLSLIHRETITADPEVVKALMDLKTRSATTLATAPIHQASPLARMAELLRTSSPTVVEKETNKIYPVTPIHRYKTETTEVLTFHEDGSVEWARVERTHRKLHVYLPSEYSDGKSSFSEDEVNEFAAIFHLPEIPTVAEVAPARVEKATMIVDMIEGVIKDSTGKHLLKFQREDLIRMLAKGSGILGWDPGLGKTIAGLVFALGAVSMGAKPRVLIVCPQDLVHQWLREIRKFFGNEFADQFIIVHNIEEAIYLTWLSKIVPKHVPLYAITWYEVLRSTTSEEKLLRRDDGDICPACNRVVRRNKCSEGCPYNEATHLLKARDAAWYLKKFVKGGVLVIDEATYIKSSTSKRGIAARRLVTAKYRLLLTGTPIKNLLSDLPMLLQLAAKPNSDAYPFPAESEGINRFSKQFMVVERNLETGRRKLAPEPTNIAVAQRLLSAIILRRTKDQTGEEIVPLKIEVHKVPLTETQAEWYRAWCDDEVFERWFIETHNREIHPIAKILSRMSHLLFVIGHPTSPTATGHPVKLSAFRDLPQPTEWTHKNQLTIDLATEFYRDCSYAVVFAQTVGVLPIIAQELGKRGVPVHLTVENKGGKVQSLSPARRGQVISAFERQGGVLLASISAMAHGHDLAFVPRAVIHSLCFAYDQYAQAIMRVHRIVSEKPVEVHVICGSRTLDDYLFDLLRRKDEAAKTVLDGTVIERSVEITPDEWQKLWRRVQEAAETIEVK